MSKAKTLLCLGLSLFFWESIQAQLVQFRNIVFEEAFSIARQEEKGIFIYFFADWCMPCNWLEDNTLDNERNAQLLNLYFVSVKLNMDDPDVAFYKEKHAVTKLPTLIFFDKWGDMLLKVETALGPDEFFEVVSELSTPYRKIPPLSASPIISDQFSSDEEIPMSDEGALVYSISQLPPSNRPKYNDSYDTPRTVEDVFGIEFGQYSDYAQVVKLAKELEAALDQKIALETEKVNGILQYKIIYGYFSSYNEAADKLRSLQAFNFQGKVFKQ